MKSILLAAVAASVLAGPAFAVKAGEAAGSAALPPGPCKGGVEMFSCHDAKVTRATSNYTVYNCSHGVFSVVLSRPGPTDAPVNEKSWTVKETPPKKGRKGAPYIYANTTGFQLTVN